MLSRRRFLVRALGAMVGSLLAACSSGIASLRPSPTPSRTAPATPSTSPTEAPTPLPTPAGPPLRESIAQLLLVGFRGRTPDEAASTVADIAERGLGGVILFSVDQPTGGPRNVASPEQLRALVDGLRGAARVPLIVAIDQEGGQVARLGPRHGFPATPSAAAMGRGDPAQTRATAEAMATTLADVGVTLNLAPVIDLAVNPDNPVIAGLERSFSADPAIAEAHAAAFIAAHRDHGVRTAIKHFPGQGSASGDTHLGIVDVTENWSERELEPFEVLVAQGAADAVLTAHIYNATLDPDHPATLSRPTVTGILRDRLGFAGPVISDDLQMGAITEAVGYDEAIALALEAGIDLLLVANQVTYVPDLVEVTIDIVERHVRGGRIGEDRILAAVERVSRLRG